MIYNRSLKDIYLKNSFNKENNYLPFLLGRNAMNYIVETIEIENIIMPYYICPMIIKIFKEKKINIYYYEQFDNNLQILDDGIIRSLNNLKLSGKTYFLWDDYLGILGDIPISIYSYLQSHNIIPIIDGIHTLPIKDYKADIVIYGFRKLLNEPFGALLKIDKQNNKVNKINNFKQYFYKFGFYLKTRTLKFKIKFFERFDFDTNELLLYDSYQYGSLLSIHQKIDYKNIAKKRKDNFLFLHENLPNTINIDINEIKCPYGYPLIVDNNLHLRAKLWKKNIHSFILWNTLYVDNTIDMTKFKYVDILKKSIVILPVNQDLTIKNLEKIIKVIKS